MASEPQRDVLSPDDALPPVEPPNARFIVQLFVIPAVIVATIVLVWILIEWLAHAGSDPHEYVKALERDNAFRWQAAVNLADVLRDSRNSELKRDPALARELSRILDENIKSGRTDDESIKLRVYLSRALGEFQIDDGLPALIKAATTQRDPKEVAVRGAAIDGLALLIDHTREAGQSATASHPELLQTLLALSDEQELAIRSAAVYALGVEGSDTALAKLRSLASAANSPEVRYNAATGLARHGDPAAVEVLLEMLDPAEDIAIRNELDAMKEHKRTSIMMNALRAAHQLSERNSAADLSELAGAVDKLQTAEVSKPVRMEAKDVLVTLRARTPITKSNN